jgi:hypothetical protein
MTTLILKKESKGYYTNQIKNIKIAVSEFNNQWTGVVTNENEIEDNKFLLFKCFAQTKKDVVNQMVNYLK